MVLIEIEPCLEGKISASSTLCGSISVDDTLSGTINAPETLSGTLTLIPVLDAYDGDYTVTPKAFKSSELETADKVLVDNIVVEAIPYWETSNPDGLTVYIAGEV